MKRFEDTIPTSNYRWLYPDQVPLGVVIDLGCLNFAVQAIEWLDIMHHSSKAGRSG
jgi:hypothetical protein